MILGRILLFAVLLTAWAQAARACAEPPAAPTQTAMEIAVAPVLGENASIGEEQRCECPAILQNALSAVTDSSKVWHASYGRGSGALANSPNPISIALAAHTRASSFIVRHPAPSPYLLAPRLRQ